MSTTNVTRTAVHPVDEVLPVPKLAVYGFQHVLAFYAGAVLVPIILANALGLTDEQLIHLINADLFTLPIAPYFARLIRFFPSVVTGTVILIIGIALLPITAGDIVQSLGPQDMAGEPVYRQIDGEFVLKDAVALKDICYALGTVALIVLIQRFFKGFMQTVAVLVGLVVGTRCWAAPRW